MGNRVFILFFPIVILSFLFSVVSSLMLRVRGKYQLHYRGLIWVLLFVAVSVPIIHQSGLISLKLFTNYTGGLRLVVRHAPSGQLWLDDLYIRSSVLQTAQLVCGLISSAIFINAAARFSYSIAGYLNNLHFLTKHSTECHDDRINAVFQRARKKAGIRRQITLRVMQREIALSPCTCGINFPAVYIGKEYLYEYSEQRLELVFLHELYHIRHCDAPTKLLTLLVTSIFSFLPGASQIRNTVSEDAEFRCDEAVLKAMGENSCGEYISVILDIAERTVRNPYQGYDYLSGISRTGDLILRRYHAMKNPNKSKAFFPLMLVLTASLALNMFLFSVVSVENMDNMGIDLASPLLEDALCSYFSVSDSKELTEKDISSIYSIEFALSEHNDKVKKMKESGYAIRCILNEGFALDTAAPQKMSRADQDIVPDHIPDSDIDMYLRNAYESGELWIHLAETKTADTRDIVLFGHLRTLIFSDRIASSCEEVYTSDKYAVISRNN